MHAAPACGRGLRAAPDRARRGARDADPDAVYLPGASAELIWIACGGLLTLGALSTGSRTAAIMLVERCSCFIDEAGRTMRLLPMLLPLLVVSRS